MSGILRFLFVGALLVDGGYALHAQTYFEPHLMSGSRVSAVRAIACNRPRQIAAILEGYSQSYESGKAVFEAQRKIRAYDAAARRVAPVCDEVWFAAVIPVRTISREPYDVYFANGTIHPRHIIEVRPIGPNGKPADASYFISPRWRVMPTESAI